MRHPLLLTLVYVLAVSSLSHVASAKESPPAEAIWVIPIDGAIGPATSDFLIRSFAKAKQADASLIIIRMNTPGGLDSSMRDIIQAILASSIPVATFVSPKGARAASAGTYILYASHIAAMAPATNLGAATPVQIGTPSMPSSPLTEDEAEPEPAGATAMERKMVNDASAYIRGLAEIRGRNADWAEEAVREASSLPATEALDENVIDFVAQDIADLVRQIDGQSITVNDKEVVVALQDKPIYEHEPDWRTELLTILTNPNLVLILGMIGVYGIILEFSNPGSLFPGTVGIICLILAGYSLQMLPLNYAGLALILVGIALIVAEAMIPSFGILGFGGIVSFLIGGLMLFDTEVEAFQLGWPTLGASAVVMAILVFATIHIALKVRKKSVTTGVETLVGRLGDALDDLDQRGQVKIGGEIWAAKPNENIQAGDSVRVVAVEGMMLEVEKA